MKLCWLSLFLVVLSQSAQSVAKVVVIEFHNDQEAHSFAEQHQMRYMGPLTHLDGHFYAYQVDHARTRALSEAFSQQNNSIVKWHEFQTPRKQHKRSISFRGRAATNDPLYGAQWHLHNGVSGMEVEPVWNQGFTGRGVTVAIVDDGLEKAHPDLSPHFNAALSQDFNGNQRSDPTPYSTDGHGTAASGVCCAARNNGQCGSGVAPDTNLVGLRTIAEPTTDYTESMALSHHRDEIDIYSNSWGPSDDGYTLAGPGRLTKLAFQQNVQQGRHGKGSIYVWAAGNGRERRDNCNYDEYANSMYTIAIGAVSYRGAQSWYSEDCAALMAVAPSSGDSKGITTTDLMGRFGYDRGQCCSSFGGTSSAAPAAAGAIAILLQAHPQLTWRDVQHVLARGSRIIAEHDTDWTPANVAENGVRHNHKYGFGLVHVPSLLEYAASHHPVGDQHTIVLQGRVDPRSPHRITFTSISTQRPLRLEHVTLQMGYLCARRGELHIDLIQESTHITSRLMEPHDDYHANVPFGWTFMTVRHWDTIERPNSKWTVNVRGGTRFQTATLTLHGTLL